ncbi:Cystathionine beta-synthase [Cladobotryum mycophilum]|uniref:Cystathionine beta-synthase n=1 Tax=Cladobotryum mycophilum TaxID=491253 RepID=A0ABR0SD07_9HYPO
MADTTPPQPIPHVNLQPPSVDFIENHLEAHHPAFKKNSSVYYDSKSDHFGLTPDQLTNGHPPGVRLRIDGKMGSSGNGGLMPPRPLPPAIEKMKFWDSIFLQAMERIKTTPGPQLKQEFRVRDKTTWQDIYAQLQKARENYDGTKKGFFGKIKKGMRHIIDNSAPVGQALKLIPSNDYLSPVTASVHVVLEAFAISSKIRGVVTSALDPQEFEYSFSRVEIFLATFPQDTNILNASVDFISSTFLAVEKGIDFFTKHQSTYCLYLIALQETDQRQSVRRGLAVLTKGENYEDGLLQALGRVKANSDRLIEVAELSKLTSTQNALSSLLKGEENIELNQSLFKEELQTTNSKLNNSLNLLNTIKNLLDDADKQRKSHEEKLQMQTETIGDLQRRLIEQGEMLRSLTPSPNHQQSGIYNGYSPPGQPVPLQQYASPPVAPAWYPSPMINASMAWYPPYAYAQQPNWYLQPEVSLVTVDQLRSLLNVPRMDVIDMEEVSNSKDLIPLAYRHRAEQIATSQQFRDWIVAAESRELLIEGDFDFNDAHHISALSLFCVTLTQALRMRESYISLVFFCGSHVEGDEDGSNGAVAIIKSLVAQLLEQYRDFDLRHIESHVKLYQIQQGDIGELCSLFVWLVHRLPQNTTLMCLIDGALHYEVDKYEAGFIGVIRCILDLVRGSLPFPMKILVTSPSPTDSVQRLFEASGDETYLSMDSFREVGSYLGILECWAKCPHRPLRHGPHWQHPLVRLNKIPQSLGIECEVYAKTELFNAGGSVKDRIALRMIEEAEKSGRIKPGDTLIEPTSGNTGIGLALVGAIKGYKTIITMPEKMSAEKVSVLRALGATIIRTPTQAAWDSPESHIGVALRLEKEIPNAHILDQYSNKANPDAHEFGTAEEIWEQTGGKVDAVVAGAGTGGTITGIAKGLKKHNKDIKVIAADPHGSILALPEALNEEHMNEGYKVEGIGYDFIPDVLDRKLVDKWYKTNDQESFKLARRLIAEEGLLVGGSSGSAMAAMLQAVKDYGFKKGDVVVVVLPDSIRSYLSKFADDDWLAANNLLPVNGIETIPATQEKAAADPYKGATIASLRLKPVTSVAGTAQCSEAIETMRDKGFDQLPVLNASSSKLVGLVTLGNLLSYISSGRATPNPRSRTSCSTLAASREETSINKRKFVEITMDTPLSTLSKFFEWNSAAIVTDGNGDSTSLSKPIAVVTKVDLLTWMVNQKL